MNKFDRSLPGFSIYSITKRANYQIFGENATFAVMKTRFLLAANTKKLTGHPAAHALARYRCFLPDLAGLAGLRCAGPGNFDSNIGCLCPADEDAAQGGCAPLSFLAGGDTFVTLVRAKRLSFQS